MGSLLTLPKHQRPLPKPDDEYRTVIERLDLTRTIIECLKNYCKEYKAKTYEEVDFACRYACSHLIFLKTKKGDSSLSNNVETKDKYRYYVDNVAHELDINPSIVDSKYLKRIQQQRKANPIEFLYYTYLLMPNLNPNYFTENMNNIKTAINTLWDRLTSVKHSSMQSMMFLFSKEGAVGKSVFQNIIREWAKANNIKEETTKVSHNQFVGDEFNKNAICQFNEITAEDCKDWFKMNNLMDGADYVVEQKGKDSFKLKAQAFLIGSSNFRPQDENNRRIIKSIIHYGETKLEPISKYGDAFQLKNGAVDIDYYIPFVDKWIASCPSNEFDFADYPTAITSSAGSWYEGIADNRAFVLRAIAEYFDTHEHDIEHVDYIVSSATLTNWLNGEIKEGKATNIDKNTTLYPSAVSNTLTALRKNGKVTVAGDAKGTYEKKYNLYNLFVERKTIKNEQTVIKYGGKFALAPDYLQERHVVRHVMSQIYKADPSIQLSQDCIDFMQDESYRNIMKEENV